MGGLGRVTLHLSCSTLVAVNKHLVIFHVLCKLHVSTCTDLVNLSDLHIITERDLI